MHGKLLVIGRRGRFTISVKAWKESGTSPLGHRLPPPDKVWNTAPSTAFQCSCVLGGGLQESLSNSITKTFVG